MRIGGPIFKKFESPEQWAIAAKSYGYKAAYCPIYPSQQPPPDLIDEYKNQAKKFNIIIAEVGAWSNPLSSDQQKREEAIKWCKQSLELAELIDARCCVNIAGSIGKKWDGPCQDDLRDEVFDLIVETVRAIIDDVKPQKTFYTLETMPWMYPNSADSYLKLIKAIDRKQFAVHFDPVNLISSIDIYYNNRNMLKDFIFKLGKHIKSCHAKDIILRENLTLHLDETRPGCGNLDYRVFLEEINKLDKDMPLMLEHLPNEQEYIEAKNFIFKTMQTMGINYE